MGTQRTALEKRAYLRELVKRFPLDFGRNIHRRELIAKMSIHFGCGRPYALNLVQAFIDSGEFKQIEENGEIFII